MLKQASFPKISPTGKTWHGSIFKSLGVAGIGVCLLLAGDPGGSLNASAQSTGAKGASGLPLPRFVSLKAQRVNMRVGPGRKYKVDWMYTRQGLPLEILQEYDNWRKVRDSEGAEGWINQSLLSGRRTALIAPWKSGEKDELLPLTREPGNEKRIVAKIEPGVLASVEECKEGWCRIEIDTTVTGSVSGYAKQTQLWGVYPDETLD